METHFSKQQLKDKDNRSSEKILRKCVHCGFCNTNCPTYDLLGDELDGPRGRIYLIKDMIENNKPANEKIVKHIDLAILYVSSELKGTIYTRSVEGRFLLPTYH